jgi:signal peptidase II
MPQRRRRLTSWLWALVAFDVWVLDQVTKELAQRHLTVGRPQDLLGSALRLDLTHNGGAAFSLGTGYTVLLTLVAVGVIVVGIRVASQLGSIGWSIALGLLLGGAIGNVTDRLVRPPAPLRGRVVDFLELPHWPVFNLADSAICVAAVLFAILTLRGIRLDGSRLTQQPGSPAE